jgi:hypothetical protein
MPSIKLQQVKNFEKLLQYLETELGWPVEGREIDDIAFPFDLETDLGLDKNEVAKVRHVYRLKKMHKKQPFGIFFVDFEGKKMPVSVLKRILRNLALKRKANARAADQLAWDVEDLIFISAVGEEKDSTREISFAHFRKEPDNRHVLKVMAWDGGDTPLKMDHLDDVLHEFLRFPDDTNDVDAWRKSWTAAFRTGLRQNIRRSEELAQALAALAMRINKEALSLIKKESANGPLKTLHAGFKDALIHDLTEEAFTDCYAQTITYGLLTAAITKVNQAGVKDLTSTSVLEMVPSTNPFLKDILSSFLEAGGRGQKGIDFDDLGVQDVIDLLRAESTDLPNILRDFGNLTQDEDPVIHFYETFLKIYNKDERVKRGAFYTPRPVVSYIVRSVDQLLRKEFGLEDGLADTITWGEMIKRNPAIKLPPLTDTPGEKKTIKETEPFVQILDPATGTATFLVEVINIIEKTVKAKAWAKLKKGAYEHDQHSKREEVLKAWNEYVPEHLLKRLHAYEIMMAPYVIAHMKVGLKLAETGYSFTTEERARIYLTNALEPAKDFKERLNFDIPALAIEAKQVNEVKRHKRFTVVIGNPPYAGHSGNNKLPWIVDKVHDYKRGLPDLQKPGQAKWLQDDYVKFLRLAEVILGNSKAGVVGIITNHSFLDNPTFRGLRSSLTKSFTGIQLIDLHGNTKGKEVNLAGGVDENVFDIQQGVSISLLTAGLGGGGVSYGELWGSRDSKYAALQQENGRKISLEKISPSPDHYLFVRQNADLRSEYEQGYSIHKLMGENGDPAPGIVTTQDEFAIAYTKAEMHEKIESLVATNSEEEARALFRLCTQSQWNYENARRELKKRNWVQEVEKILYRPFDTRWTVFNPHVAVHRRLRVTQHLRDRKNLALITTRSVEIGRGFEHVFCTRGLLTHHSVSLKEGNYVMPLYLRPNADDLEFTKKDRINLSHEFIEKLARLLEVKIGDDGMPVGISPEVVFNYIYAVLHSPGYRKRYAEFLRADFPRLPLTKKIGLILTLSKIGGELVSLHLLESSKLENCAVKFEGDKKLVEKVLFEKGNVWIDKAKTSGFSKVEESTWEFHIGGYQVCEKWLDDRRKAGRKLSKDDIEQYIKVVAAISGTVELMVKIDRVIEENGGWPKAFQ